MELEDKVLLLISKLEAVLNKIRLTEGEQQAFTPVISDFKMLAKECGNYKLAKR